MSILVPQYQHSTEAVLYCGKAMGREYINLAILRQTLSP